MINPTVLHEQLVDALLPVDTVNSAGRVLYTRALTPAESTTAATVIAAHDGATQGTRREQAIRAAAQLAQALTGAVVNNLTAGQVRNLVILLAAKEGWVKWNGSAWVVDINAQALQQLLRQ